MFLTKQEIKNNYFSNINKIFEFFFILYIFVLPFNHMTTFKSIGLIGSLLFFSYLIYRKEIIIKIDIVLLLIVLYFIYCLVSIFFIGIDIKASLQSLKTGLLEQCFIYLVVVFYFYQKNKISTLLYSMSISYILLVVLSLFEVFVFWYNNGIVFDRNINDAFYFYSGFSHVSVLFFPLFVGFFLCQEAKLNLYVKIIYILFVVISFFLILYYQSTTISVISFFVLVYALFIKLDKRYFFYFLFFIMSFLFIFESNNEYKLFQKITKIENFNLVNNNNALSGRSGLWHGLWTCMDNHFILGYGYGWEKVQIVCSSGDILEKIQKNGNEWGWMYFKNVSYGSVNPHNTYLEILFSNGIIGLTAVMLLLFYNIFLILKNIKQHKVYYVLFLPIFVSYLLSSFMNGYWIDSNHAKILMILIGLISIGNKDSLVFNNEFS